MTITINGIQIEVERKMIRTMRLAVCPPLANVRLSIPLFVTDQEAERFVTAKWQWIVRTRQKVLNRPVRKEPEYVSGEGHYLFGRRYTLVLQYVTEGNNSVTIDNDSIILRCRQTATRERRKAQLYLWYRTLLQLRLTQMMDEWCTRLNEPDVTWTMRLMKRQWGSCRAATRRVVFNTDLARVPVECVEYVVVHELTHLVVQNHGPAFKALLTQRLPNWQKLKKQLNDNERFAI